MNKQSSEVAQTEHDEADIPPSLLNTEPYGPPGMMLQRILVILTFTAQLLILILL